MKTFQQPYRSADDFHLKWLKDELLVYLDTWEQSIKAREGFSNDEKKKMHLSPQTLLGLRITVNSFVELVQYLFTLDGVESFLSQKISQDPLEKFFGCQRQRGATSDNPNVSEFRKNLQTIRIVDTMCRSSVRGNCRGVKDDPIDLKENTPLRKRKNFCFVFFSNNLNFSTQSLAYDKPLIVSHMPNTISNSSISISAPSSQGAATIDQKELDVITF
ncbi:hypothetical protein EMCRGX_G017309 [Ephydatia muelleri]